MAWWDHLHEMEARYQEITALLSTGEVQDLEALSREHAALEPLAQGMTTLTEKKEQLEALQPLLSDSDPHMRHLAEEEHQELTKELATLEAELKRLLLPKDENDERNALLEIRAGTGGDEASLFASDLLHMYSRYAQLHRWSVEILESNDSTLGGYNRVTLSVSGKGVFGRLKFESGVHRVQRIPVTESGGRIHTSAATVAVLLEARDIDVQVDERDLRIDTYRAQGAGGQHVNKTDSAVRLTHLPSGIVVQCQDGRSQHKNKEKAMRMLLSKLYDREQQKEREQRAGERRQQVGTGDRSERIRTYNFPQGRVTDHRIQLTLYKLEKVLTGEALDEVIEALLVEDQAKRLAYVDHM